MGFAIGTVLPEIPSHETKSNLASVLTLSIFELHVVQTPNRLQNSKQATMKFAVEGTPPFIWIILP